MSWQLFWQIVVFMILGTLCVLVFMNALDNLRNGKREKL